MTDGHLAPMLDAKNVAADERDCIVLVDGEHYPAAVSDAISDLQKTGWNVRGAALVGGGEKLRETPDYGVPHVTAPATDASPAGALRAALAATPGTQTVIDLADEPVLVLERRLELMAVATAAGCVWRCADSVVRAPVLAQAPAATLAIIGTGKRIGKTAVSAHAARLLDEQLGGGGDVVVVAMGRGGPADPIVIDRADGEITIDRLLEISRGGAHAASDYLEDAALTGLTTVGCRRVSGGLLGVPAASNVPEGMRLAAQLDPMLILLEGSGSCVPPVRGHATLLLATTERPDDLISGTGPYRVSLADMVLIMGDDRNAVDAMRRDVRKIADAPDLLVVGASLIPAPVGDVTGRKVAAFTTAPSSVAPLVRSELEALGAEVVLVSCNLARRHELVEDLQLAIASGIDAVVVEIKAAAIDAVAEAADAAGIEVIFLDNVPRPHRADVDLEVGS